MSLQFAEPLRNIGAMRRTANGLQRQSPLGLYDHMVYVWYESYESVVLETDWTKTQNEFRQRKNK